MLKIHLLKKSNLSSLSIFLFMLGIIIFLIHGLHISAGREIISEVNKSQLMIIKEIASDYESLIQEIQEKLATLARLYSTDSHTSSNALFDLPTYYALMHDNLAHIGIMGQNGMYTFFYPEIPNWETIKIKNFSTSDFFQNALQQAENRCRQSPFISTEYDQIAGIKAIPISIPLYSDHQREKHICNENTFSGILIFFLDFAVIQEICQNHYAHLHDYSSFWLIDDKGTFLSHENHDWVGKNIFSIDTVKFNEENIHGIDWIIQKKMLQDMSGTAIYMDNYYNAEGNFEKCYINYTPVHFSDRDWSVAATTPAIKMNHWEQRVLKSAWQWTLFIISFMLIALSFFQIVIFLLHKKKIYWEKEQRKKFQSAFDGIQDFVYMIDVDHTVLMANKALMEMCGKSREKLEGNKCFQSFQNRQSPCPDCPIPRSQSTKETQRFEKLIFKETVRIYAYPLTNDEGKTKAIVLFAHIITKEKILEQELQHRERLSLIGKLAACVAHEIKNPLIGIGMLSQLVKDSLPNGNGSVKNCDKILYECQRLEKLIDNLSKFSRLTPLSYDKIDIHKSLDLSLALLREKIKKNNIKLITHYNHDIPLVTHDEQKMQQVFLNLIINSINAMKNGGTLNIRTYLRLIDSHDHGLQSKGLNVFIDIKDTGRGIPQEEHEKIFKPFFSTSMDGTGLGLSIVQSIIHQHGGQIYLKSHYGKGTLFSISLPLQ
ncbi:MAG: ATP-binding protein [bacterium]